MTKKRQTIEPIDDMRDTMKKLLALELFRMNVAQVDIAKKLHMDLNAVNAFLKGIKK